MLTGKNISHYRVLSRLGGGGMGEVYLARDTLLDRNLALKFLSESGQRDPSARRRFIGEAKAAAAIDHPYVCKVYEAGEDDGIAFIAMEFVEGETLRDRLVRAPLDWKTALRIGTEATEALAKAHEKGIVHRDLKPTNIMLVAEGHVKLLDFGLATRTLSIGNETVSASGLEDTGFAGTLDYMSPEQVRGLPVDPRTDVFSLGVVFYEMLTAMHPFRRPNAMDTAAAILTEAPPPVCTRTSSCPVRLGETVARMMAKEPAARFHTAGAAWHALRSLEQEPAAQAGVAARVPVVSIAVLPFLNMSADREQEYFSDGVTEDIILQLSKIPGVRVIARTSCMRYKNTRKALCEIARELGVEKVLEGSVRWAGTKVRVTSGLVDVETNEELWADAFDRDVGDIFAIQTELSRQIATTLAPALSPSRARIPEKKPHHLQAYQLHLKGRHFLNKLTPESVLKSIDCFEQALVIEPGYARSLAGLSTCYAIAGHFDFLPRQEAFPKAKEAAHTALELDDGLAEAHTSAGLVAMFHDWEWTGADRSFRRAIEINPSWPEAHTYYSWCLCLLRRFDEGIAEATEALELDPVSAFVGMNLGWVLVTAGRFDEAIEQLHRTQEIDPNYLPIESCLGYAYTAKGMHPESIRHLEKWTWRKSNLALAYALAGRVPETRDLLHQIVDDPHERPSDIGLVYLYAGDREEAARWIERASEDRDYMLALHVCPDWAPGRSDPLVQRYLRRMGLDRAGHALTGSA